VRWRFLPAEQEVGTCQATQKAQDPPSRLTASMGIFITAGIVIGNVLSRR
jgi:hypothetical protein